MAAPKKILSLVDLKAGSQVRIKPHYTLAELLAKSRGKALKPSCKDREWLSGGPVGKEAI